MIKPTPRAAVVLVVLFPVWILAILVMYVGLAIAEALEWLQDVLP